MIIKRRKYESLSLRCCGLAREAERVHVVFNNNLRDQGIRGATTFGALVSERASSADVPRLLKQGLHCCPLMATRRTRGTGH